MTFMYGTLIHSTHIFIAKKKKKCFPLITFLAFSDLRTIYYCPILVPEDLHILGFKIYNVKSTMTQTEQGQNLKL